MKQVIPKGSSMKKFIQNVKADVEKQVVLLGIVTMIILTLIMVNPLGT